MYSRTYDVNCKKKASEIHILSDYIVRQMTILLIFAHLDVFNVVCFRLDSLSEFKIFLAFKDTCMWQT